MRQTKMIPWIFIVCKSRSECSTHFNCNCLARIQSSIDLAISTPKTTDLRQPRSVLRRFILFIQSLQGQILRAYIDSRTTSLGCLRSFARKPNWKCLFRVWISWSESCVCVGFHRWWGFVHVTCCLKVSSPSLCKPDSAKSWYDLQTIQFVASFRRKTLLRSDVLHVEIRR